MKPSAVLALFTLASCFGQVFAAEPSTAEQALQIFSRQKAVFTAPPIVIPARKVPDGPLQGNGDVGAVIGGVVERQKYFGLGASRGADVNTKATAVTNLSVTLANNVSIASAQSGTVSMYSQGGYASLTGNYTGVAGTLSLDSQSGSHASALTIDTTAAPALAITRVALSAGGRATTIFLPVIPEA